MKSQRFKNLNDYPVQLSTYAGMASTMSLTNNPTASPGSYDDHTFFFFLNQLVSLLLQFLLLRIGTESK